MFCEESYNAFFTWLNFITKLNSNQLNIKKVKSTKIILKKNKTKKGGKLEKRKVILKKKEKGGNLKKKRWKKKTKKKKKEECTVDYYCNPQCIGCGWTVNSSHPLAYYLIVIPNQLNINKKKIDKDNFRRKKLCGKKHCSNPQ